jgi:solute carrier family 25 carnitine/acylcarnitine transporter 20/29
MQVATKEPQRKEDLAEGTGVLVNGVVSTPPIASPRALFVAGLLGGVASTLAGHPFDTVKVRLQTMSVGPGIVPRYSGPIDCLRTIIRDESFRGLFKGISAPLATRAIVNALGFASFGMTLDLLQSKEGNGSASIWHIMLAGAVTGITVSPITTSSELVKIRLQVQRGRDWFDPKEHFPGALRGTRLYVQENGFLALFRGFRGTLCRDVIAYPAFFITYFTVRHHLDAVDKAFSWVTPCISVAAGGAAGMVSWASAYPFDLWKSNVQRALAFPTTPGHVSFRSFIATRYRDLGVSGLFTGMGPTMLRAIPVNSAKLLVYDLVVRCFAHSEGLRE